MEFMSKRDMKKFLKPFGITAKETFIKQKDKIYMVSKEIENLKEENYKLITAGVYIGKIEHQGLRLSIEGTQLLRPEDNVLQVKDLKWLEGKDIETKQKFQGFVAIKHKDDFLGSGLFKQGKIQNYVPKIRRIKLQ